MSSQADTAQSPICRSAIEHEVRTLAAEPGVRLPGDRRLDHRRSAATNGVEVPDDLMALLDEYAANGSPATPE